MVDSGLAEHAVPRTDCLSTVVKVSETGLREVEPGRFETREAIEAERQRLVSERQRRVLGRSPTPFVLAEIEKHICEMADENLGRAFEVLAENDEQAEVLALQQALGHTKPGLAYILRQILESLRFGVLPASPTLASRVQRRLRTFREKFQNSLSAEAAAFLSENESLLDSMQSEEAKEAEDNEIAQSETAFTEQLNAGGVYAFTYPHYLRHPIAPSERTDRLPDRTLYKVGSAAKNIRARVDQIANTTAAPEPRRILRLYLPQQPTKTAEVRDLERTFHLLLDAAGHAGPRRASRERQPGGTEWFATSTDFLDAIASTLGLEIVALDAPQESS